MAANVWTHPKHKITAAISTLMGLASFGFGAMSMVGINFFTREQNCYPFLMDEVACNDTACVGPEAKETNSGVYVVAKFMIFAGVGMEGLGLVLLILVFWPVYLLKGAVLNVLLRVVQYIDFIGAYLVFGGAWLFILHSAKINHTYMHGWQNDGRLMQMDSLPLGLFLLSFVTEVLCVMGLNVTRDVGCDGITHLDRLVKEKETEEMLEAERTELAMQRRSLYEPSTRTSRSMLLESLSHNDKKEVVSSATASKISRM